LTDTTDSVALHVDRAIPNKPKLDDVAYKFTNTSPSNQPKDGFTENDDYIPLVPSSEVSLSPEQTLVLNRVKDGRSVFFTGSAGLLHPFC
jgi:hypothetical protein